MNILHHQALAMKYMSCTKVVKLYVKKNVHNDGTQMHKYNPIPLFRINKNKKSSLRDALPATILLIRGHRTSENLTLAHPPFLHLLCKKGHRIFLLCMPYIYDLHIHASVAIGITSNLIGQ